MGEYDFFGKIFCFVFYVHLPTDWCLICCEETTMFESPGVHLKDFDKQNGRLRPASGPPDMLSATFCLNSYQPFLYLICLHLWFFISS